MSLCVCCVTVAISTAVFDPQGTTSTNSRTFFGAFLTFLLLSKELQSLPWGWQQIWYCTTNITSTTTTNYNHYNNHIILLNLSGAIVDKFALEFTHTECKLGLGSNYGLCRREKITILSTLQEVGQDSQNIF